MAQNNNSQQTGVGLMGLLFLLFVFLKLSGSIAWSWWWITAPLWGPLVLFALGFIVFVIIHLVKGRS